MNQDEQCTRSHAVILFHCVHAAKAFLPTADGKMNLLDLPDGGVPSDKHECEVWHLIQRQDI